MSINSTNKTNFTAILTISALICFAANSVLNRLALGRDLIDASSYLGIRIVSGAVMLWILNSITKKSFQLSLKGDYWAAIYLFLYGITFSLAYRSLNSGMGAFILFGTVQTTMISMGLLRGERLKTGEWLGLFIAVSGLIYLVFPGLSAPNPFGAALMLIAGISWAFYTLKGRGVSDALQSTTINFVKAIPFALAIQFANIGQAHWNTEGVLYACMSGAITSGIGYAIWYAALKGLTNIQASLLQLSVPIIAAVGGVFILSETITIRLLIAGALIIGGIALALFNRNKK